MSVAIKIENISKQYRLGQVGTGTISHDLNRWWANIRGKEDPYSKVGQINQRDQAAESDYVWALKDIDFEVEQGEVLGIIGANGAGKSTLLKIISRITSPTTGSIKAKGRIASLLEVGTGMHPEMTARENIYLNGAIMGMKRREITKKFDDIIDFAGCKMYVDTPVKRFSSGMSVRLGFAVAAFLEPEILIVDEVLAVGDAEFQKKAIGKMKDVSSSQGRTILFVSHNMAAVENLCSRLIAMHNGAIGLISNNVAKGISEYISESVTRQEIPDETTPGIIHAVEMLNNDGNAISMIKMGDGVTVRITFRIPYLPKDPGFGIAIENIRGTRVFWIHSRVQQGRINIEPNKVTIECLIQELRLTPGRYYITVGYDEPGKMNESLERIHSFEVESSDLFGTGRVPMPNKCDTYLYATWSITN